MDSPPKLSGETLIVHHIPLVHCQVSSGRQGGGGGSCGSAALKRSNPFSPPENLGLSRTTSLPERDVLQREALLYSSLIQTSGGSWERKGSGGCGGGRGGGSTASDDSSFASSNSEEQMMAAHTLPRAKRRNRNPLRRNPFLLNAEDDDDEDEEEEEEEEGDNLSGYLEDSSFHLHSDTSAALEASFHLHGLGFGTEPFRLHSTVGGASLRGVVSALSNHHLDELGLLGLDAGQRRHGSSGSNVSMDWGEEEEEEEDEDQPMRCGRSSKTGSYSSGSSTQHCPCCALSQNFPQHFTEPDSYCSDSSCNSSDGVLVNFSAIYSKMNNGIPEKSPAPPLPPPSGLTNLNSSADHSSSCASSASDPLGTQQQDSSGRAFYLDLHTSPTEALPSQQQQQQQQQQQSSFPLVTGEPHLSTSSACSCAAEHQGSLDLDPNCNTYQSLALRSDSCGELASCLQSQARLVVATQNYYKLVTCDLSSQSSPSPAGSSANSCSDEHSRGSPPTPTRPSQYFLFRQPADDEVEEVEEERVGQGSGGGASLRQDNNDNNSDEDKEEEEEEEEEEVKKQEEEEQLVVGGAEAVIQGQVYVNVSPPLGSRVPSAGRPRSRSYDRNLDKSPPPRLGSLERMLSCPMRLSEGAAPSPPPPPRVTSFAEIARSKRRNAGGSPSLKAAAAVAVDPFSSTYSTHSHSSVDFSPIPEQHAEADSHMAPFTRCYSQGSIEQRHLEGGTESRAKAEGGSSSCCDSRPAVVRYRKDQRPTTLPIQPFTFHHQFATKPPQPKPLPPLLLPASSVMQAGCSSTSGSGAGSGSGGGPIEEDGGEDDSTRHTAPPPVTVRPSPLGSYSPVRLQGAPSSSTCSTCSPSPPVPPHSHSCPLSTGGAGSLLTPPTCKQGRGSSTPPPPPSLGAKRGVVPPVLPVVQGHCFHRGALASLPPLHGDTLSPLGGLDSGGHVEGNSGAAVRAHHANHLSPQALKWKEYRRRNPLGVDRLPLGHSATLEQHGGGGSLQRPPRRNVFDFPSSLPGHALGRLHVSQSGKLLQNHADFQPDYFSLTEKPPEEFCLSPDASTSTLSSCSSSSQSHISVDLTQKRGLVKAVNTAVDLIVAHFGTSRDPDVKAKLGNSWVSPNVGHLILKYLCPALHEVLQDGLKAYVLDLIIGQRRCQPWSLVEASTQLGPSTRVLHSLFSKVSQFSELTNHSMRLNAFIFGLLNLKSLEFWFSHLYTHEDVITAHYNPWGFLPLSQGACKPLFEELLLLLQPLSLLPFDLDLLFEPHLLQKGREQLRRKEQLCSAGQSSDRSARSTFQLMRGWSATVSEMVRDSGSSSSGGEGKRERPPPLRREGTWPRMEVGGANTRSGEAATAAASATVVVNPRWRRDGGAASSSDGGASGPRLKGVGQESQAEGQKEWQAQREDRQAGWWYQLMQSSQVYIDPTADGCKFVKSDKRRKSAERRRQPPPSREGVVEGAESSNSTSSSSNESTSSRGGRLAWMGSPPESVVTQEKDGKLAKAAVGVQEEVEEVQEVEPSSQGQVLRWGRLFGAGVGSPSKVDGVDQRSRAAPPSRPPSGWLSLDLSGLSGLVAQTIGAGKKTESPATPTQSQTTPTKNQAIPTQSQATPPSRMAPPTDAKPREVRALCHHIATEPGQLSFNKGDIMQVVQRADPDWLLCSLGSCQGLVPIVYVTLRGMEESLSASSTGHC